MKPHFAQIDFAASHVAVDPDVKKQRKKEIKDVMLYLKQEDSAVNPNHALM